MINKSIENTNKIIKDYSEQFAKFATNSAREEAEAASQNQLLLMVDFLSAEKVY